MILFMVELKDQPGELARLADAIGRKGINIESITGATSGSSGTVALLTNDEAATRKALAEDRFSVREAELVTTSLEHKPGTLAAAAKKLADAGINVSGLIPIGMAEGKVSVGFATDQPAKAREILGTGARAAVGVG